MIPAGVFAAFAFGIVLCWVFVAVADRRARIREAAWWEELRGQALDGYGRLFDWAEDDEP